MGIDENDALRIAVGPAGVRFGTSCQHEVVHQLQHERRFAAPRFGDRQQVTLQQTRRQHDRNLVALMLG